MSSYDKEINLTLFVKIVEELTYGDLVLACDIAILLISKYKSLAL